MSAQYARTIAELIESYQGGDYDQMVALDELLRQLADNWYEINPDDSCAAVSRYPLIIPVRQFLATTKLGLADVAYIKGVTAHVQISTKGAYYREHQRLNGEAGNIERSRLRQAFPGLEHGLTLDMLNDLGRLLPTLTEDRGFIVRPGHLPVLQILHVLLLRSGFWPKVLQEECLNPAVAGYDPLNTPKISPDTLAGAYINREEYTGQQPINDITTFVAEVPEEDELTYMARRDRIEQMREALNVLASLVSPELAAFNNTYFHYREALEDDALRAEG